MAVPAGTTRPKPARTCGSTTRYGHLLYTSVVPPSPGDASLSFFGVVFDDARIARIKIVSGDVEPGPYDEKRNDVVVMDDFIFGEPRLGK